MTTIDPRSAASVPGAQAPADEGTADVTVLGAGVVGMATAYAAARRGLSVRLVDRAAGPALGTSFANGAQRCGNICRSFYWVSTRCSACTGCSIRIR